MTAGKVGQALIMLKSHTSVESAIYLSKLFKSVRIFKCLDVIFPLDIEHFPFWLGHDDCNMAVLAVSSIYLILQCPFVNL